VRAIGAFRDKQNLDIHSKVISAPHYVLRRVQLARDLPQYPHQCPPQHGLCWGRLPSGSGR